MTTQAQAKRCSECGHRRKINAKWEDTGAVLCRPCSLIPGMALRYSIRETPVPVLCVTQRFVKAIRV